MGTSNGAVFASSDGGVSWQEVDGGTFSAAVRAFAVSGTKLFASTEGGGVWVTEDFGVHWADGRTGLPKYGVWSLAVVGTDLFAGTWGAGIWRRPIAEMTTSVGPEGRSGPYVFGLDQNYPNPFNPTTVVSYQLSVASNVKLVVYDILGREVSVLVNERKNAGSYEVTFDAGGLASGVYFYRLTAGSFTQTRKMAVMR